jgi:hypothetical protein
LDTKKQMKRYPYILVRRWERKEEGEKKKLIEV